MGKSENCGKLRKIAKLRENAKNCGPQFPVPLLCCALSSSHVMASVPRGAAAPCPSTQTPQSINIVSTQAPQETCSSPNQEIRRFTHNISHLQTRSQ